MLLKQKKKVFGESLCLDTHDDNIIYFVSENY
jgi:hypothetical protein